MRNRNRNALKHGVFANTAILPGEDPREFEQLHSALIEEWAPVGPTEDDAVLSIAKGVWRKRRVQKLLQAEIEMCRFDPKHPAHDEAHKLSKFLQIMQSAPFVECDEIAPETFEQFYKELETRFVPIHHANYLREKCPRQNFESSSAWLRALRHEIASILLPSFEILVEPPESLLSRSANFLTPNVGQPAKSDAGKSAKSDAGQSVKSDAGGSVKLYSPGRSVKSDAGGSVKLYSPDVFKRELALDERIDVMIDRAIKRLVQTKAMKQVLRRTSPVGEDDQPKKFQSGKPGGSAKVINYKGRSGE
jgi:hypothetical protein